MIQLICFVEEHKIQAESLIERKRVGDDLRLFYPVIKVMPKLRPTA